MAYILLIIGFAFLIKGADLLVDGSASLARRFKISYLVIGLTVVSIGTSMPELLVNLIASFQGNAPIAIGNVVGSNIANILLILGVAALIYPVHVTKGTIWKEIPLSLLAVVLLGIMANDHIIDNAGYSAITRIDGFVFLSLFLIFMYYVYSIATGEENREEVDIKDYSVWKASLLIIVGVVGLALGGNWVVDSAVTLAQRFGVSQSFIGLTVVALGTSLPELATAAAAALKHKADIAIGNVVGSNIFNIFWILGLSAVIKPLPFQPQTNIDIGVAVVATFLLFSVMFLGKKHTLNRWEGGVFLTGYLAYITFLVVQG